MEISSLKIQAAMLTATDLYAIRAPEEKIAEALRTYAANVQEAQRAYVEAALGDTTLRQYYRRVTVDHGQLCLNDVVWPADLDRSQTASYEFARRSHAGLTQAHIALEAAKVEASACFRAQVG